MPPSITAWSASRPPACSTTASARATRTRSAWRRSTCSSTRDSLDLVQHIETVLDAVEGHELADRINSELMQSVVEIATPVCSTAGDVMRELVTLRAYVRDVAGAHGLRVGSAGTHPFSLFERQRITAKDRYRALDRPAAVHRPPRADLRDARARRRRRPRQGDPGRERPAAPARAAARALGQLAVLARRAHRARLEPADGVLGVPALGPAAALPRLRRLRRGGRPARAHRLHRRLHAHLVGHPPPSEVGHDRDPDLRRGHARRGRGRDRRLLPGARQAPTPSGTTRGERDPDPPPDPHDREQVARRPLRARGAGHGSRDGPAEPRAGREARPADAARDRAARRELGSERELEGIEEILARGNGAEPQLRVYNANRDIVEVVRTIADATEAAGGADASSG